MNTQGGTYMEAYTLPAVKYTHAQAISHMASGVGI